ncbi:MAG TPA: membrane protein insertase YidC [bacterium]|mgnify:CR=1 FL=1|nr:membrane protein insertase YidC [bacterium]
MDMNKKTILAFLLIGFILILVNTPFYQKLVNPKGYEARQKAIAQRQQQALQQQDQPASTPAPITELQPAHQPEENQIIQPGLTPPAGIVYANKPERLFTIETDLYTAQFSSHGAVLKQWNLKKYQDTNKNNVQMIPTDAAGTFAIQFETINGDTLNTAMLSFDINADSVILLQNQDNATLSFITNITETGQLLKVYEFSNNSYQVKLDVSLINLDTFISGKAYSLIAPDGLLSTEKILKDDMMYAKAGFAANGKINKNYKANGHLNKIQASIDWVGVRTKYFTLSIIPQDRKGDYAEIIGHELPVPGLTKDKWKKFAIGLVMPYLGETRQENSFILYIGPLDSDLLKTLQVKLEDFLDMGAKIIYPFSVAILWSFKKLHLFIPNYGIVLIIFSILIKIIIYPLTHKSFESMKRMQSLAPKLNELKEKYKSDPQRLNQETMKLYKQEKVNPMGSCLPTLLQLPLLWALFIVFRTTIELRHEPFFWWIKDLSNPDTIATLPFAIPLYGDSINILPLFMGITMFIQQKMTMTDPKQKMLLYFMPIFLTLLFNSFPSGLNLYYALFNILSIIQQKWLVPDTQPVQVEAVAKKKK